MSWSVIEMAIVCDLIFDRKIEFLGEFDIKLWPKKTLLFVYSHYPVCINQRMKFRFVRIDDFWGGIIFLTFSISYAVYHILYMIYCICFKCRNQLFLESFFHRLWTIVNGLWIWRCIEGMLNCSCSRRFCELIWYKPLRIVQTRNFT